MKNLQFKATFQSNNTQIGYQIAEMFPTNRWQVEKLLKDELEIRDNNEWFQCLKKN